VSWARRPPPLRDATDGSGAVKRCPDDRGIALGEVLERAVRALGDVHGHGHAGLRTRVRNPGDEPIEELRLLDLDPGASARAVKLAVV
jgi:hypothetical protein